MKWIVNVNVPDNEARLLHINPFARAIIYLFRLGSGLRAEAEEPETHQKRNVNTSNTHDGFANRFFTTSECYFFSLDNMMQRLAVRSSGLNVELYPSN